MNIVKKIILAVLAVMSFASFPATAAPCKPGFVKVPAQSPYFGQSYCIMEREMFNPATGQAWEYVSFTKLQTVCAMLSANSELPTNTLWQGIARKAATIDGNWTGGAVGSGQLKTDITVPDGEGGNSTIYDFGDNHWEWVRGSAIQISPGFIYQIAAGGQTYTINGVALTKEEHYGDSTRCTSATQCGVTTQQATSGIARGGDDSEPGFYGVASNHDTAYAPGYSDFSGRCAYPASDDN